MARATLGPFFSKMLHFAFTGKQQLPNGKSANALSKVRAPAMHELFESILKAVLPNFSSISSSDTLVEKLHAFLQTKPDKADPARA